MSRLSLANSFIIEFSRVEEETKGQATKSADNCGTGAGGFKPGNDCAAGRGGASGPDASGESQVETEKVTATIQEGQDADDELAQEAAHVQAVKDTVGSPDDYAAIDREGVNKIQTSFGGDQEYIDADGNPTTLSGVEDLEEAGDVGSMEAMAAVRDYTGSEHNRVNAVLRNDEELSNAELQVDAYETAVDRVRDFSKRVDAGEDPLDFSPEDKAKLKDALKSLETEAGAVEGMVRRSANQKEWEGPLFLRVDRDTVGQYSAMLKDRPVSDFDLDHKDILQRADDLGDIVNSRIGAIKETIDGIDNAVRTSITTDNKPVHVYRGMHLDDEASFRQFLKDDTFTTRGYMSTSLSAQTAADFGKMHVVTHDHDKFEGKVFMKIRAKNGQLISTLSQHQGEAEVLLPRGTKYRITKRRHYVDEYTKPLSTFEDIPREVLYIEAEEIDV